MTVYNKADYLDLRRDRAAAVGGFSCADGDGRAAVVGQDAAPLSRDSHRGRQERVNAPWPGLTDLTTEWGSIVVDIKPDPRGVLSLKGPPMPRNIL